MALQPSLRPLLIAGKPDAPHTLDVFRMCLFYPRSIANMLPVDYVCPFR
jgi:hypothetical protein